MTELKVLYCIFLLTFFELTSQIRPSLHGHNNAFVQDDNDVQYLLDNIPMSMHKDFTNTVQGAGDTTSDEDKTQDSLSYVYFKPHVLDFKERQLGIPHQETVILFNSDQNKTIHLLSISGNTRHFHSSFFRNKVIPPLGNTTFDVIFLGREEGDIDIHLFIHTADGTVKYQVKGISVSSPYRLRPVVDVKLPLNATFTPLIYMHNPHSEALQVLEVYSSGGEFQLELPSGEAEGSRELWEIPPYQTKPIIRLHFNAYTEKNHTAYIRLKVNNTSEVLVVTVEVEVKSEAGLHWGGSSGVINLGMGGSLQPPIQYPIALKNSAKKPIKVMNIISTPVSKALKLHFEQAVIPGDTDIPIAIGTLIYDWKTGLESQHFKGKLVIKAIGPGGSSQKLTIPWVAQALQGGLEVNASITHYCSLQSNQTRNFSVVNKFKLPLAITNVTMSSHIKALFTIKNFIPRVIKPEQKVNIFSLQLEKDRKTDNVKMESSILIHSNVSVTEVPLLSYDGKVRKIVPEERESDEGTMNFGTVGSGTENEAIFALENQNPINIDLHGWGVNMPGAVLELMGCQKGPADLLDKELHNITVCSHTGNQYIKPGHLAIFKIKVKTPMVEEDTIVGDVFVRTTYERFILPVYMRVAYGRISLKKLIFTDCFPGSICVQQVKVYSTFIKPMQVTRIAPVNKDNRIKYIPLEEASMPVITKGENYIGSVRIEPSVACKHNCYLGLSLDSNAGKQWLNTLALPSNTRNSDLNLLNIKYTRFLNLTGSRSWDNITMRLDTTEVRGHKFYLNIKPHWPSLLTGVANSKDKVALMFPLTQIGNTSYRTLKVYNPSITPVIVQLVMDWNYPQGTRLYHSLPTKFKFTCADCGSTVAEEFKLEESIVNRETFEKEWNITVASRSIPLYLKPSELRTVQVSYTPFSQSLSSAFLYIRNNMTILEVLRVIGQGANAQFRFGNRKPGSTTPLLFELAEKHLKDCERERFKRSLVPNLTVKRSFMARNTGELPIEIYDFYINGLRCEGYGFKVLNCTPFKLIPNAAKKVEIQRQKERERKDVYRARVRRKEKDSRDAKQACVLPSLDRGKKDPIGQQSAVTVKIQRAREMSLTCRVQYLNDVDPFAYASSYPEPPRPPVHTFSATLPLINQLAAVHRLLRAPHRLDDTALQLYKDGDYGAYLDLEASISEQQEEFEGFQTNRKNSIVLRTQLSVRVHTIIEKLLNSEGRELRRALFSLKQIFQEDKDLVHEFVQNDGLACLIKVGSEADQNYQNYILRALGQVMLYVDGMNGVMEHGQTVQWLYTLIASRFRLVVKTALKLLLVFVEYVETNSLLLVRAVRSVDTSRGMIPWTNVMKLLKDYDAADTELLIYATTLVNKCLNGIPDQDTYYDQVDCLEEQGIEGIIQRYMSKQGTDLDLLRQFQIYEAVLHHEDGNDRGSPIRQLDDNIRKTLRNRKSLVDSHERRKSRRHSTGTSPLSMSLNARLSPRLNHSLGISSLNNTLNSSLPDDDDESSSSQSSQGHLGEVQLNGSYKENKVDVGVTPALRRRRERAERQRSFIREQQEATATMRASVVPSDDQESPYATNGLRYTNGTSYERNADSPSNKLSRTNSRKDLTPLMNAANKLDSEEKKPWYGKSPDEGVECDEGNHTDEDEDRRVVLQLKREGTVKDLTQKLAAQNLIPSSPVEEKVSRIGDMSGLISKAKEGLAKSKSKADVLKSPTGDSLPKLQEAKKSENELHWEELVKKLKRPLELCDLDFTDLNSDDEVDILGPVNVTNGVPPPPPPMVPTPGGARAPPPPPLGARLPPPVPQAPPPLFGVNLKSPRSPTAVDSNNAPKSPLPTFTKKSKKTVKLFWKEVRDDPIILSKLDKNKMIWDELSPVSVDTQKLEHLFESRAKDLITKEKQQEMNKNKEIIVLDHKRSNAINIGMTKLPLPKSIKIAILKMDATIMNREGIEKLLTMLPTEEERSRIQEAQAANPDLPLGSAEQFLLTLASISELPARLKLWAFKLDFENSEKEIADPLMDLKQGMETLRVNKTFRGILSTLLSIGIFLNGNEVKGFQLEYLAKVPEVKDTVHKHSLLHHLCHMVMEKFPDSTDLYSEIGAVTRASKIDFDELAANIGKLESECKASWDYLKLIAKHDGSTMMKVKMSDFLADCAERIIVLGIVHRRIINRFHKFILWLGIPLHRVQDTKPNEFCRIVSEFALEYRTTRERVIQQLEKKANHRERNKTRGKMITEVGKFWSKEDCAEAKLRQLLENDISDVESIHSTWRRQRKDARTSLGPLLRDENTNGNLTDGDDELLESLVKTATKTPATRTTPRERKRTRHADRKSLRRTLKNGLSEEEKKHIATYIKGY